MTRNPARFLHPSNSVTYLGLLAAMLAATTAIGIRSAALAGCLIALSVLADTLDGRFAKLFKRDADQRRFGREIDSLSDAVCFGFTPVVCVTALVSAQDSLASTAWLLAGFVYLLSTVTRLAAYNLQAIEDVDFVGIPAPVSGLAWAAYLLAEPTWGSALILALFCSVAMLVPVRIPRPSGIGLYAFMLTALLLAIVHGLRWAMQLSH